MNIETRVFKVVGKQKLHCASCEKSVGFLLQQLPGVQRVDASHKTQEIRLVIDAQRLDLGQVTQQLDWLGYEVTEVTA